MIRKYFKVIVSSILLSVLLTSCYGEKKITEIEKVKDNTSVQKLEEKKQEILNIPSDNINPSAIKLMEGARKEATNQTKYIEKYYNGGFPVEGEGVCTDVIWRAFKNINVDIKKLVDEDIKNNINAYPRIEGKAEPNIDFRRVPNLNSYFKRKAITLTTEIIPGNVENLRQWQPGDIVVMYKPYQHIGIVSDKRNPDGVPYFIHNFPPHAEEISDFLYRDIKFEGHYRWKY